MLITFCAKNTPDFQVFLERNPVTKDILCAPDLRSVAKILAAYAKKKSAVPIEKDSEIGKFLRGIHSGDTFDFKKNVKKIHIFDTLFNEISIALVQEHLFNIPMEELDTSDSDSNPQSVIASYEDVFGREQSNRLITSSRLLKYPIISYRYVDKKSPVTLDEAAIFLQRVEEELKKIPGQTLETLLLTGGHGSPDFLNNLSQATRDAMIDLFHKYNVRVDTIAMDCCFGAWHLNNLRPILSKSGQIIANYMESNEHSILQAFQPSLESTSLQTMEASLMHNPSIVVHKKATGQIFSLKPNVVPDTPVNFYAQAKTEDFKQYVKSQGFKFELTTVAKLLENFKAVFAPTTTPVPSKKPVSLANMKRLVIFPLHEGTPELPSSSTPTHVDDLKTKLLGI